MRVTVQRNQKCQVVFCKDNFCELVFDPSLEKSYLKAVHKKSLILNPQDNNENDVTTEESMEIESDEDTIEENALDDTLGEEEIDNGDDWFYASDSDENDSCDDDDEDNIKFCSRNYVR